MRPGRVSFVTVATAALTLTGLPLLASAEPPAGGGSSGPGFEFGLVGDQRPTTEAGVELDPLVQDMAAADLVFTVHNGGIGAVPADCTDDHYLDARDLFDAFAAPLVYTPGDDDWVNCHRRGHDPYERLASLRRILFPTDQSPGSQTMGLERQGPAYPENTRWGYGPVTFATLHVVGAADGRGGSPEGDDESSARRAATVAWLDQTFEAAQRNGSDGVVLIWHADPHFREDVSAHNGLRGALRAQTVAFAKPVVLVHGQSDEFGVDRPMADDGGRTVENFTRVRIPGPAHLHWVRATVNPADPGLFTFRLQVVGVPPGGVVPVLVGAGDIALCGRPGVEATAKLLDRIPGVVFTAGDNVQGRGTAREYTRCYEPTWGRHRARTKPTAGNHEYATGSADAYFTYFGAAAGERGRGYYSYDVGAWHVVVLNSNCTRVGGCQRGSPQERWLRADLAAHPASCTLAYWHHSRFSSGGGNPKMTAFWQALYDHGAEVVVSGHAHRYERFAPQTPLGRADRNFGIRQFVVGTGGTSHHRFRAAALPNSQARNDETFGVLKLTLGPTSYDWEFIPVGGQTFTDSGTTTCHGRPAHGR